MQADTPGLMSSPLLCLWKERRDEPPDASGLWIGTDDWFFKLWCLKAIFWFLKFFIFSFVSVCFSIAFFSSSLTLAHKLWGHTISIFLHSHAHRPTDCLWFYSFSWNNILETISCVCVVRDYSFCSAGTAQYLTCLLLFFQLSTSYCVYYSPSFMGRWIPDLIEGDFKLTFIISLHGGIKSMTISSDE